MISTAVLNVLWSIAEPVLSLVPDITINYDGIANSSAFQFIRAGLYFFPMDTVLQILYLVISLWTLRVVIAFLHSLWSALPLV